MCRTLVRSIPDLSLDEALETLDRRAHALAQQERDDQFHVGPFSAFSLCQPLRLECAPLSPGLDMAGFIDQLLVNPSGTAADREDTIPGGGSVSEPQTDFPLGPGTDFHTAGACHDATSLFCPEWLAGDAQDDASLNFFDLASSLANERIPVLDHLDDLQPQRFAARPNSNTSPVINNNNNSISLHGTTPVSNSLSLANAAPLDNQLPPLLHSLDVPVNVPADSRFLLAHYKAHHLKMFSPICNDKSPWHIMQLPTALQTFANILVSGSDTYIRTSILYSVLSISALTVNRVPHSPTRPSHALDVGDRYHWDAKRYLQMGLKSELAAPRKTKYKDLLMAFLGLITVCVSQSPGLSMDYVLRLIAQVINGRFTDAEPYILDTERLIYSWGTQKARISRKVAMLHNIFLYIKVIHETMSVPKSTPSTHENLYPAHHSRLMGSLSLYTHAEDGIPAEGAMPNPGMFEYIYGVPFSLICFLSRITAMGSAMSKEVVQSRDTPAERERGIRALEADICEWRNPYKAPSCEEDLAALPPGPRRQVAVNQSVMKHLVIALHNAVLIWFYRRILHIHPYTLQAYVRRGRQALVEYEETKSRYELGNLGIAWPAFVIGCEAQEQEDRVGIGKWLQDAAESSGARSFRAALEIVQKVWERRDNGNAPPDLDWRFLIGQKYEGLLLT